jgi:hypothetical protein
MSDFSSKVWFEISLVQWVQSLDFAVATTATKIREWPVSSGCFRLQSCGPLLNEPIDRLGACEDGSPT